MGGKLTVYVVDDSRTQAEITRALLEKAGHEVILSTASQEALAKIPCVKPIPESSLRRWRVLSTVSFPERFTVQREDFSMVS